MRYRDFPLIAACAIAVYFIVLAWPGLSMLFAPDDMQNIYRYWEPGPWKVIEANVLFVTSFYRPLGGLFYLPLFRFFGFDPLPYRVVIFALVCLNAWLLYLVARYITGSRETGAFAALAGCFHPSAAAVLYSTAMIYEVLCFGFMCATLIVYVRARAGGRMPGWRDIAAVVVLFVCALNSKEMAVVIPVLLAAYEAIYYGWRPLAWRRAVPIVITGAIAAAYTIGKLLGANSLVVFEDYRPAYTLGRFMETSNRYAGYLFQGQDFSTAGTIVFWVALFALAGLLRRRNMLFGAVFSFVAFLPLNFVPPRDGFVLYIPLIGFAIYAADLVVVLIGFVAGRFRATTEYRLQASALVFILLLGVLSLADAAPRIEVPAATISAQTTTWRILEEFRRVHPRVKKGSRLLLVDSPIHEDWDMYFIAKLYFNDRSLKASWVRPAKQLNVITGDARAPFDNELRWVDDHLVQTK